MKRDQKTHEHDTWQHIFDIAGKVVEDVRHKVLEEGWFGRQVTGSRADVAEKSADQKPGDRSAHAWEPRQPSFDESWAARVGTADREPADRTQREIGIDL